MRSCGLRRVPVVFKVNAGNVERSVDEWMQGPLIYRAAVLLLRE